MNKTLLLIICDFLLLNLLALTRWEKPPDPTAESNQPTPADTTQQVVQEDLVGALRVTLDEERQAREAVAEQLLATQQELQQRAETLEERERRLAALREDFEKKQQEAQQLSERVADTQATVVQLSDRLTRTAEQAASSRAQAEQLAKELAERQAAAERLQQQLAAVEQERSKALQEIQTLGTRIQVAETERTMLRENVETLQTQVVAEREERLKLQQHTGTLAEGVTQLAERTADVRDEIRSNTPINANTLFNDFLANRIDATFTAERDGLFGRITGSPPPAKTLLVSDGTNVFALFHARDTIIREGTYDWRMLQGSLRAGGRQMAIPALQYLTIDPRVLVVPVDNASATAFGKRVYPVTREPFKFPEAVLVSGGGRGYGEVEFRLDPQTPGFVRMDRPIFGSFFGDFAPSAGDIVLSKTGELLGVMVNSTYCALVDNFTPAAELRFGENLTNTGATIAAQKDRILRLPLRLQ